MRPIVRRHHPARVHCTAVSDIRFHPPRFPLSPRTPLLDFIRVACILLAKPPHTRIQMNRSAASGEAAWRRPGGAGGAGAGFAVLTLP